MRKTKKARLQCSEEEQSMLKALARSKTAPHREVIRAGIILKYMEGQSITAIAALFQTNRPLVERCLNKALAFGVSTAYLLTKPGRFEFVFTPRHGSWLNMTEMFFSKIARSFLRHIRVENKEQLIERIYQGINDISNDPVIFRWKYKMDEIQLI